MELLLPRPQVGGDPGSIDPAGSVEVGQGDVVLQGEGVAGSVVAKELGASTERVQQ